MPNKRSARRRSAVAVLAGAVVLAAVVLVLGSTGHGRRPAAGCTVADARASYPLSLAQTENAATIAAVGKRRGLADHAVTVALAAALQESGLRNLSYGDRDSIGLFQQRPSQGWGSTGQLRGPRYAAAAFYDRLVHVPGWQSMPVTAAAQRVQRSAAPAAYARWEAEARALARALTGEVAGGLRCGFTPSSSRSSQPGLAAAVSAELGPGALEAPVPPARGWLIATWLVAHAYRYDIGRVTYRGRSWTPLTGRWQARQPIQGRVRAEQRRSDS